MALSQKRKSGRRPVIGLVGFGAFGQLAARHLACHAELRVFDPKHEPGQRLAPGIAAVALAEAARCSIVILTVPVRVLAATVREIAPHMRRGALVLDVGSVKVQPTAVMAEGLPRGVDVIGTHPLFGPQSARDGLRGLKIALCPVRGARLGVVSRFLRQKLGLQVIVTTPEAHDRELAVAQGLTHLIAAALLRMEPLPSRLTTASFDLVREAVEMVRHDSADVLHAIERANPFAAEVRERFLGLLDEVQAEFDERRLAPGPQDFSLALPGS